MRLRFTFNVVNRGALIPFHHQYLIAGFVRRILDDTQSSYPYYSFSGVKGQTRLGRNGLHFNSRKVTIVFSSTDRAFMDVLSSAILAQDMIEIGALQLIPELAEEEQSVALERETRFVCISPIALTYGEDLQFVDPISNRFSDILYDSTLERMQAFGIDTSSIPDIQKFQIIPDPEYLKRMKDTNRKFSRIYPIKHHPKIKEVRGYTLPFTLFAASEIQNFLYTCGMGSFTHLGFGLLDLVDSDPLQRAEVYKTKD